MDTEVVELWAEAQTKMERLIGWLIVARGPKDAGAVVVRAIYEASRRIRAISPSAADEFLTTIREIGMGKKRN